MNRPLVLAVVIALIVALATRRPFLALAAGAFVFWWQNARSGPRTPPVRVEPSSVEPPDPVDEGSRGSASEAASPDRDGVLVRCEVAGPVLQRWVSETTGRGYEVPPPQGVPGAEPGMRGVVVVRDGAVYVMRRKDEPERSEVRASLE